MTAYQPYQAYPPVPPVMMTPGPPPILVAVAPPAPQPRFGVFFRLILVIPHVFVLFFVAIAAFVVAFLGWWGALFTARLPRFAVDFLSGWVRWWARVNAYLFLLTDAYPPFSLGEAPEYPVRIAFPPPQRLNRAAVFFRFILVAPVSWLAGVLAYGAGTLMAFVAWLITLVTGRLPVSLHLAYIAVLRFQIRFYGYYFMLTPAYPGGLYGDLPGAVTWADGAQAAQAPGFGTPESVYGTPGPVADTPGWGYGVPGQDVPGGYGTPGDPAPGYAAPDYPAPGGYGAAAGYQAEQAAQPGSWPLLLTSAAKRLVTVFIVLGVLLDVGSGVYNAISSSSRVSSAVALAQLDTDYSALSSGVTAWKAATTNCQSLTCVTAQDSKAASLFATFSSQLASISVPAGSAAAKAKVAADATAAAQDFTQLSKSTTTSQYQATVASTGMQNTLNEFDTDFSALEDGMTAGT